MMKEHVEEMYIHFGFKLYTAPSLIFKFCLTTHDFLSNESLNGFILKAGTSTRNLERDHFRMGTNSLY